MNESQKTSSLVWGVMLIVIGILLFAGQVVSWFNWGQAWPLFIIGVGVVFFVAMVLGGKSAAALAVPGSIISTVGAILLVQNIFNTWETWSYTWGLIIAGVGVGVTIQGIWNGRAETRREGLETLRVGLTLFLIFGILMEFIFSFTGVSGRSVSIVWPILLVLLGLFQIIVHMVRIIRNPTDARHNGLFGPILLTGIGTLAVLAVWKVIPAAQVLALLNLWPVLLIAAGIQIIVGKQRVWVGAILGILVVGTLVGMAFYGPQLGLASFPAWISLDFPGVTLAHETVTGSGDPGEETRSVSGFDRVRLEGVGKLVIVPGENESLTIRADENLLPYITADVRGRELVIGVKRGYSLLPKSSIEYTLALTDLSALYLDGAGTIEVGALETDKLRVSVSGAGGITLSDVQAKSLDVEINGSGWVNTSGQVDDASVEINGAGSLEAGDLQCQQADVNISGLGKVTLWVTEKLSAEISGAGSVSYYGTPSLKKRVDGVGSIQSLGAK
jgi:hypothetical protein